MNWINKGKARNKEEDIAFRSWKSSEQRSPDFKKNAEVAFLKEKVR